MIRVVCTFGFSLLMLSVYAQHKLEIVLIDQASKENIINATIKLFELDLIAQKKINSFLLQVESNGIYHLEIDADLYETKIEKIAISGDTIITIQLNKQIVELNQVIVTAVSKSTELMKVPYIIKPIDSKELRQNTASNLIDGLKNIPGINQVTTGNGISKPVIRGLGYNRVISLFNGVRQEGQQWGDEHGIEIDEYLIDRIEIVKGPGSLMYGSDGIAGVINFITPKIEKDSLFKLQIINNLQSNNRLISNSIYATKNTGNKSWGIRLSNKFAGNYQNKLDGKVYNSGFREFNGSLFYSLTKKWGMTQFHLNSYNAQINIPEGERDSFGNFVYQHPISSDSVEIIPVSSKLLNGYSIGFPNQMINHIRFLSSTQYKMKNLGNLLVDIGIQKNLRKEFGNILNPSQADLFFDLTTSNLNLKFNLKDIKNWQSTIGTSFMFQKNKNKGLEFIIPDYAQLDAGIFFYSQKTFSRKFSVAGGIRYDFRNLRGNKLLVDSLGEVSNVEIENIFLKFNSLNVNFSNATGSIGLSYQPTTKSTFKFNISRGFRTPSIAELSSNGKHEGALRYEYGNQNLKSEISHQLDIAYFLRSSHLSLEVTPYVNSISNFIYVEKLNSKSGSDSLVGPEATQAFQFQQTNAILVGAEFYSDFHPHPLDWLHIENSFSFVNAYKKSNADNSHYLPFIPAPKYRLELKGEFNFPIKQITKSFIKANLDYYFDQNRFYRPFNTETFTRRYSLINIGIGFTFQPKNKKNFIQLFLNLDNLLDKAYQNSLSRLKYAPINPLTGQRGIYNMGRNFNVKLIIEL